MGEMQIFNNPEFGQVRVVEHNGEPWFVGKDVAEVLGYKNTKDALLTHVDKDDKRIIQRSEIATFECHIPKKVFPVEFVNGNIPNRGLTFINESGVYSLILSSKLPKAKQFKRWVTSEILPAIHKHGAYMTEETLEKALTSPDFLIKLATELKTEKDKRIQAEQQIKANKPKVIFADAVSASDNTILIGDLAKLIKQNGQPLGQKRLFSWLRDNGYLIKRQGADYNSPTQKAMELGVFKIKETAITHADGHVSVSKTVKVTGRGQQYFINKFLGQQGA
jgi:anti-repressor protein